MDTVNEIIKLKSEGMKINEIAEQLNLPVGTVKSKLFRHKEKETVTMNEVLISEAIVNNETKNLCKMCGKEMSIVAGKRKKEFCCDYCRVKYWRKNRNESRGSVERN